jgi:hypothetical protein
MVADEQMDFACIESFDAKTDKVDTDFYRTEGNAAFAKFTLPKSDLGLSASAVAFGTIKVGIDLVSLGVE